MGEPTTMEGVAEVAEVKTKPAVPNGVDALLTKEDVAATLQCCKRHLEKMISTGQFPRPDLAIGNRLRWRTSTVNAWIGRGGKPEPAPPPLSPLEALRQSKKDRK